jgi:hypothetical protein
MALHSSTRLLLLSSAHVQSRTQFAQTLPTPAHWLEPASLIATLKRLLATLLLHK